jgi:transaldolase
MAVNLATYLKLTQAAADHGMPELMLQMPSPDPVQALQWLAALRPVAEAGRVHLTFKLPCHLDWLGAIRALQQEGQSILLTALASPVQLLWAQSLKVDFVAPYVGRLAAEGRDVWSLVQACVQVQNDTQVIGPALLAASIKTPDVLMKLLAMGAAAVTLPPASLAVWSQDAQTNLAMDQFAQDVANSQRHA